MGKISELRQRYERALQRAATLGMDDAAIDRCAEWAAGDEAYGLFGRGSDVLDSIFLLAWQKTNSALTEQIRVAIDEEGRSWNEVAAALGVSRQAAVKRHGWGTRARFGSLPKVCGHPSFVRKSVNQYEASFPPHPRSPPGSGRSGGRSISSVKKAETPSLVHSMGAVEPSATWLRQL